MAATAEKNVGYAGNEKWTSEQDVTLTRAYFSVSQSPLGNGAQQTQARLYVHVLRAYHVLCKKLSTAATTPLRSLKNYRPRTANALRKRYLIIALECGRFVEADVRASHIEKKSGHTLQMFRDSAHNFYNEKHK